MNLMSAETLMRSGMLGGQDLEARLQAVLLHIRHRDQAGALLQAQRVARRARATTTAAHQGHVDDVIALGVDVGDLDAGEHRQTDGGPGGVTNEIAASD